MERNGQDYSRRGVETDRLVDWLQRQWKRYDTVINGFTQYGRDETAKKALCLAFVQSVLNDTATEKLLSDVLFETTYQMVDECEDALGKNKVANARASMLFLLWCLPLRKWKTDTYDVLRDYCCRDRIDKRPAISFRHFLDSTMRTVIKHVVEPLADIIEPWL